jgi:hypothetical protein
MEAALITTWGNSVPGREKQAIECFMDYMVMLGKQAAEGNIEEPEPYFTYDGSGGMGIVRGQSEMLMKLWESDDFREILSRAQLTVNDVRVQIYAAGESVQELVGRFTQVAANMGYM